MSKTTHIRQQTFTTPLAASATALTSAHSLDGSTLTSFTAQPDMARRLSFVASGATTANVVITGTDVSGATITETLALTGTSSVKSVYAYATVTNIVLPTVASTTVNIGTAADLALDSYCDANSFCIGAANMTSFTYSTTVLAQNTVVINGTLNGSNSFALGYVPAVFPTYSRIWG